MTYKIITIAEPMRRPFSRPGGTLTAAGEHPALKRRAIVGGASGAGAGRI